MLLPMTTAATFGDFVPKSWPTETGQSYQNSASKKDVAQDESGVFNTSQSPTLGVEPEPIRGSGATFGA